MMSLISKHLISIAVSLFIFTGVSVARNAGDDDKTAQIQALIGESMSKVDNTPESMLNCIAELKRIEAMFPDSPLPKYQAAFMSLNYAVSFPHAENTATIMAGADELIGKMEKMKGADMSDVHTLKGFYYMVLIVRDPAQNGQKYYLDVMANYDKALKLNPENGLAKTLQARFFEGMSNSR
ncbi:MAG: hypothetical protein K6C37_05300 [Bacteroidales bacterium]|nr:hypothetical protein [Bacteroidales bacterium]